MMIQDNGADLMFRVHDTGIGMEHEFLNRIFRPFEQESIETGKKFGGTGLGMAITDQLVRLMGGEIIVDSALGKGSDFTVVPAPAGGGKGRRIERRRPGEGAAAALRQRLPGAAAS